MLMSMLMSVSESEFYYGLLGTFWVMAAFTAINLLFRAAPYGRYQRKGWGPEISATLGWVLMEAPASLAPLALFFISSRRDTVLWVFTLIWQLHYFHRAFVFPFRRRGGGTMPLAIALTAVVFNLGNAYLNWRFLAQLGPVYDPNWLTDPRFVIGTAVFLVGFVINQHADYVLLHLRKPGETGYKIPYGGMYRLVSCPNYLGEIIEWSGFALASWSPAGLCFALWTIANLLPRARTNHLWYKEKFPEYPPERRAVIPWIY
mgnify:CR=1 FL=1